MPETEISRIALEPDKRGGQPLRSRFEDHLYDVLGWLASGMNEDQILCDHPNLERADVRACLAVAADRERRVIISAA